MSKFSKKTFADRLRHTRESWRNITQSQLAEKAGLPATSICHFESAESQRKPSFDNIIRLAKALNITTDYLLGSSESPFGSLIEDTLYKDIQVLNDKQREFIKKMIRELYWLDRA